MKHGVKIFSLLSVAVLAVSCQKAPQLASAPGALTADAKSGFVIRAGLGIYDISDGAAKWLDTLLLGEKLSLQGGTQKATVGADQFDFLRVKRASGAAGWALADYIVSNCVLSVTKTDEVIVYKQPMDAGATGTSLSSAMVVARLNESVTAPFARITWYDPASRTLSRGVYAHDEDLSTKPDDVQSAVLLMLASGATTPEQKKALLQSAAKSYPSSLFIARIEDAATALAAPPVARATEKFFGTMVCTDNGVNVRDAPDEKSGSVVATLTKGQKVEVEEQTTDSYTIGTDTAPWYRIKEPAGWVFGAWLGPE